MILDESQDVTTSGCILQYPPADTARTIFIRGRTRKLLTPVILVDRQDGWGLPRVQLYLQYIRSTWTQPVTENCIHSYIRNCRNLFTGDHLIVDTYCSPLGQLSSLHTLPNYMYTPLVCSSIRLQCTAYPQVYRSAE